MGILELLKVRHLLLRNDGLGLSLDITSPVGVKNHKVVVLWHMLVQSVVFAEERHEQIAWPVVSQFLGHNTFSLQHKLEKGLAVASSLHALVNVKVQDAEWFDLFDLTVGIPDEQVPLAHLDEPYHSGALCLRINLVIAREQPGSTCDDLRQSLCLCGSNT